MPVFHDAEARDIARRKQADSWVTQRTSGRVFDVQYHPEAGPGPHDPFYLFRRFRELMETA